MHVCSRGSALEFFLETLASPLCLEELVLELQELVLGHHGTALLLELPGVLAKHHAAAGLEHLRSKANQPSALRTTRFSAMR